MGAIGSQITSLTIVYSTVYSGADQSKHQSSASLAFVWGIHRGPVNSPHKWPVTLKMFPFDDVIMDVPNFGAACLEGGHLNGEDVLTWELSQNIFLCLLLYGHCRNENFRLPRHGYCCGLCIIYHMSVSLNSFHFERGKRLKEWLSDQYWNPVHISKCHKYQQERRLDVFVVVDLHFPLGLSAYIGYWDVWIVYVRLPHYGDVMMGAMASLITSLTIVYSTVYSGAGQRNIKATHHWPLCAESGKCFHLMTSSRLSKILRGKYIN